MKRCFDESMCVLSDLNENGRTIVMCVTKAIVSGLAEGKRPITYTDVSNKVEELCGIYVPPIQIGKWLGYVQDCCLCLKTPTLPALVVNQRTKKPGESFIDRYRGNHPDAVSLEEDAVVNAAQSACRKWESWQEVYDCVGLDEKAPKTHEHR